jgi:hypothetical protein
MTLVKPLFHVGVVVQEIQEGMTELTNVLGLSWGRVQRKQLTMETPGGTKSVDVCYAYSIDGPPYLELIEQRTETVFAELGLHHVGVWTDDPTSESARLDGLGWPRESVIITSDGTWGGGLFHRAKSQLRLELVDIARSGPRLINYLGGGNYELKE